MISVHDDPAGTDGFEFVEFSAPDPQPLRELFARLGFALVGRHRWQDVTLHRQGDIHFLVNAAPGSAAQAFAQAHGPSACAMGFRVRDAAAAYRLALERGAHPGPAEGTVLPAPCLQGIGGALLYLVDRHGAGGSLYEEVFEPLPAAGEAAVGLVGIDHLTHNVYRGAMDRWAGYYERLFGFRELRYFDIEGRKTGLLSRAMVSPCGRIRIPINESQDERSQIEEYLREYRGEGIQHIALATEDIYHTVAALRARGVEFQDTPESYYEGLEARLPGHGEPLEALRAGRILLDGEPGGGRLLQIFTRPLIGPIFFEIIQRKGHEGFGEGNFRALFESIELDQIRRGVI